jgi:hypothetical protein|tara:strand:- start:528 stop:674 length:147 start_codon:yes stop_codon:yes gene_type:complete
MAHKELEKVDQMPTLQSIRHAREPDKYPSRKDRWEQLLREHPKKKKRR